MSQKDPFDLRNGLQVGDLVTGDEAKASESTYLVGTTGVVVGFHLDKADVDFNDGRSPWSIHTEFLRKRDCQYFCEPDHESDSSMHL